MSADPRKDYVVRLIPGIRFEGQGNERLRLEENGTVLKIKGVVMQQLGCFIFYAPSCLSLPMYLLSSVTENGATIFHR